ncbi:MAG TPA: hypothetical protein VFD86_01805, partial [Nitrospira sp.]|nr:hypothetical protein [Nitrospira sp.]
MSQPRILMSFALWSWFLFLPLVIPSPVAAQTPTSEGATAAPSQNEWANWHYSAYLDVAYLLDFNFPENHRWRSRTTSSRFNEFAPNMGFLNIRKDATAD